MIVRQICTLALVLSSLCATAQAGSLVLNGPTASMSINFTATPTGPGAGGYVATTQTISLGQTLNGVSTTLYCVDLGTGIAFNDSVDPVIPPYLVTASNSGQVTSLSTDPLVYAQTGNDYGTNSAGDVNNANQIAWLIQTYASTATTADQIVGLQAAIWKAEYGAGFDLYASGVILPDSSSSLTTAGAYTAYQTFITDIQSGNFQDVAWYSTASSDGQVLQGFVGAAAVPEPSSLALALIGFGAAGVIPAIRRRK